MSEIEVTEEMLMAGWKAHLYHIEKMGTAQKTDLAEYRIIFKAMIASQQGSIPSTSVMVEIRELCKTGDIHTWWDAKRHIETLLSSDKGDG